LPADDHAVGAKIFAGNPVIAMQVLDAYAFVKYNLCNPDESLSLFPEFR
jgi:hypothetical protein